MIPLKTLALSICLASLAVRAAEPEVINIATSHTSLTLAVEKDGRLYQLGYGKGPEARPLSKKEPTRESEFLPCFGNGYILEPAIQATHADGNTSTDLQYVKHETQTVDGDVTLTKIEMKDAFYPFFVNIYLKAYNKEDLIEAWTHVL